MNKMNKMIKDGKVAVIIHMSYGCGWFTSHGIPELIYDPAVVNLILECSEVKTNQINALHTQLVDYIKAQYDYQIIIDDIRDLGVVWIEEGTPFLIQEYDGNEYVVVKDSTWQVA